MTAQLSRERIEQYLQSAEGAKISDFDSGKLIAVEPDYVIALCRLALAGMDSDKNSRIAEALESLMWPNMAIGNKAAIKAAIDALRAAPPAPVAVPDDIDALRKDAARYRFLRDKDAFGEENESGLVTWDELAELELNDFDAEIDARMNHPNVAWVAQVDSGGGDSMAEVYSELYRLREEVKGPEGFATWKDAAIAERISKKSARNIPDEIDYLHAMATFHSDQWHKMGPITGYMHGWNAFRAAMLNAGPVMAATVPDGWTANCDADAALVMLDRIDTIDCADDERIESVKNIIRRLAAAHKQQNAQQNIPENIPGGWINCSDRLPPEGHESDGSAICYLVWHKHKVDCGPQYGISNVVFLRKHWEKWYTHWVPLPAAPEQEV